MSLEAPATPADLLSRARAAGVELSVEGERLRFRAPPSALTPEMRALLRSHRTEIVAILREEGSRRVEHQALAANQRGLWFLQRLTPESSAYNLAFAVRIHSELNVAALAESLQVLVDRHEILRSTFPLVDGNPERRAVGHAPIDFARTDARTWPPEQLRDVIEREYARPFDLTKGPVLRARVYEQSDDQHVFLLAVHHIAVDGTALFVLLEELFAVYPALVAGTPIPPPDDAATFSEFVSWQESALAASEADRAYWTGVLLPPPPPLALPTDRPRPRVSRMCGGSFWRTLDPQLTTSLRGLAAKYRSTDFVLLLSAWFALLQRITGQTDLTVGTPVLGRPAARFARTVGDLINMLPLRVRDMRDVKFHELLERVRTVVIEGMARQDFPLPRMVAEQSHRSEGGVAPFQTLFMLQDFSRFSEFGRLINAPDESPMPLGGLMLAPYSINQQEGQFDLYLDIWQREGELYCAWKYDSDLWDKGTVEGIADQFVTLLRGIVATPEQPVSRLPLLAAAERDALVQGPNRTDQEIPSDQTVVTFFGEQVKRRPKAVAVSFAGRKLTYGELDARSNLLARHLQALGVGPESLVAMCVERGFEVLVTMLAILKAGGAYVPLDPSFPSDRLLDMLADSKPTALVTQRELATRLFGRTDTRQVLLDADGPEIDRQSAKALKTRAGPENRAYVIYTSGSTGRPKGVEIEHRALTNFLLSVMRTPGLREADVLLAVTTVSFDIAGLELFLPLLVGARIELVSRETAADGFLLAKEIERSGATVMQATPATWRMLLASGWWGNLHIKVLCGGEPMGKGLAEQLLTCCGEVWNMYGPTETTIWSSVERITSAEQITIGRPIANTRMYVLDEHGEPVPRGVVGELWIGGTGLARGYLNRPELTNERFVSDPFHGGRMYRTGDLARLLPNGRFDCLGRTDQQVKIRGFRIELGEIESVLSTHPDVTECAVVIREIAGEAKLVAYVVGRGEPAAYRQHLRARLPEYMIPSVFVSPASLPRTPNEKIDRKALPEPALALTTVPVESTATMNPIERAIADIFEDVLAVRPVNLNHNFFELGGHSLLATRLATKLRAHFAMELPLRSIFLEPTVAGLAKKIRYQNATRTYHYVGEEPRWNCLVPVQANGSLTPFFLVAGYHAESEVLLILSNFVPYLGSNQPVIGLRPRWVDGHSSQYASVEEMATELLTELRAYQPNGPYLLGGHCACGPVAFEMAQQLLRAGEEVEFLFLLDSQRPSPMVATLAHLWRTWPPRFRRLLRLCRRILARDPLLFSAILSMFRRKLRAVGLTKSEETSAERLARFRKIHQHLAYRYRPGAYPGRITVMTNAGSRFNRTMGWKSIAQDGLEVLVTPGDRRTCLSRHSDQLAKQLRICLERAHAAIARRNSAGANGA